MPGKLDNVVDNLLEGMHQISKIETVVGEPLQAGDAMLVPIHRLRVGFGVASVGAGGHGEKGEGQECSRHASTSLRSSAAIARSVRRCATGIAGSVLRARHPPGPFGLRIHGHRINRADGS